MTSPRTSSTQISSPTLNAGRGDQDADGKTVDERLQRESDDHQRKQNEQREPADLHAQNAQRPRNGNGDDPPLHNTAYQLLHLLVGPTRSAECATEGSPQQPRKQHSTTEHDERDNDVGGGDRLPSERLPERLQVHGRRS